MVCNASGSSKSQKNGPFHSIVWPGLMLYTCCFSKPKRGLRRKENTIVAICAKAQQLFPGNFLNFLGLPLYFLLLSTSAMFG